MAINYLKSKIYQTLLKNLRTKMIILSGRYHLNRAMFGII